MTGTVIQGRDVILYFTYNGVDEVVACFRSCSVHTQCNYAETSTLTSGNWRTFIPMTLEWDGQLNGLCSLDNNLSIGQMRAVQFARQSIPIKFISTDPNGLTEIFTSVCILTDITNGGTFGQISDYTILIKGVAEMLILNNVALPPPDECCDELWAYYDGVGGEFSFTLPILVGTTIAGRLYRDGIEYRPALSASDSITRDGTGVPVGKEFSFDSTTGAIGFDTNLPPLQTGEQIDIPYMTCVETEEPPPCEAVGSDFAGFVDGQAGVTYTAIIPLTGTPPFTLLPGYTIPDGASLNLSGSNVFFVWTPPTNTTETISFTITNCAGQTFPFSETLTVPEIVIPGNITLFCDANGMRMDIDFITPIPASLTLLFAQVRNEVTFPRLTRSGDNIMTDGIPVGTIPIDFYDTIQYPENHKLPFSVLNIPTGTTTISIPKEIYLQGFESGGEPSMFWSCNDATAPITDIWVKIANAGYAANFTITNGGVTTHNV